MEAAACVAAVMVLGLIPGKLLEKASLQVMAGSTSADGQLGWAHYLMLGMNGETYGGHSPADVTFTTSFATASEKTSANVSKALERVQSRSFAKNVRFLAVKAFKAFDDGTFAMPRSFLMKEDVKRSDGLSAFLREIYRKNGRLNQAFSTMEQGVWLLLLLMLSAGMLLGRANRASAVVSLTLLGLAAYLLLFEAWPRYLFVYAPMFVAAAANAFTIGRQPKA